MKQIACCCDCYSTDIRIEGICSWDDLTQAITLDETTEIYCNDCDTEVDDYEVWPVEKVERLRQEYLDSQDESEEDLANYCDDCGTDDDTVEWDDLNDVQLCKKCKEKREGYAADQYAAQVIAEVEAKKKQHQGADGGKQQNSGSGERSVGLLKGATIAYSTSAATNTISYWRVS